MPCINRAISKPLSGVAQDWIGLSYGRCHWYGAALLSLRAGMYRYSVPVQRQAPRTRRWSGDGAGGSTGAITGGVPLSTDVAFLRVSGGGGALSVDSLLAMGFAIGMHPSVVTPNRTKANLTHPTLARHRPVCTPG